MTSLRRNDVASTSFQRHVPTRFLINQCQIIIFLILKSDIIENSRIELRGIVLPVPSNQIIVSLIIILPFNLVYLWFFPVSHRNWRKRCIGGGGGGGQRVCWPPLSNYWGGGPGPPPPWPPLFLRLWLILHKCQNAQSCFRPWSDGTKSIFKFWNSYAVSFRLLYSISGRNCLHNPTWN